MSLCELCRVDGFLSGHGIRIQKLVDTPSLAGGANILCQALCCQELASHWLFQNPLALSEYGTNRSRFRLHLMV